MPDSYIEPKALGPVERLIRAIRNRRAHKRNLLETRVFLFSASEYLTVAIMVDRSEGGTLLWAPKSSYLRQARFVLDHTTGEVLALKRAWRAGKRAGFRFVGREHLDVYTPHPELEHVRAFWSKMAGPSFH